jgi:hypothetical protein
VTDLALFIIAVLLLSILQELRTIRREAKEHTIEEVQLRLHREWVAERKAESDRAMAWLMDGSWAKTESH